MKDWEAEVSKNERKLFRLIIILLAEELYTTLSDKFSSHVLVVI